MLKLQFCGAARTVTGSCYLVDNGQSRILVDCGLFQGSKAIKERNYGDFPFNPAQITAVVLTHAHIDHCGLIPKLYKHGYRGPVYATPPSLDLCAVLLPDSGHIQEMEVERKNRKNSRAGLPLLTPIYTAAEAEACLKYFRPLEYGQKQEIAPGVTVRLQDAGHILGSAIVEMWLKTGQGELKIAFSGDLGNPGQPIVNDPTPIDTAEYVVMESTYGNRFHTDEDKIARLRQVIQETRQRGGNLVIPAFAVERTQDLLYALNVLLQHGEIQPQEVFVDSPLAIAATEIFCRYARYFDAETRALASTDEDGCPLTIPNLHFSRTTEESMALNKIKSGAIIISASGMADAGRIKHHLKHNLWRPECTILLVGFQAEGTLGRRLLEGEKKVRIHGEEIAVRAQIVSIDGFSAHADQPELLNWLKRFQKKPGHIFITHGEEQASLTLARLITSELGITATVPHYLEEIELRPTGVLAHPASAEALAAQEAAAEAEAAYMRLQRSLKAVLDKGFRARDYHRTRQLLLKLEAYLENLEKEAG
ncbi:MAG: metallo-beta-lactamase family protein [Clostridia bacterium]|nr:metallo-beta-lactamase family protein [Clostridia bacterium]